jgi:hypothetical protein
MLHLISVPPSVDRNTASAVEVREGHNTSLFCNAYGNPTPTVVWRRNDRGIIRFSGDGEYGGKQVI